MAKNKQKNKKMNSAAGTAVAGTANRAVRLILVVAVLLISSLTAITLLASSVFGTVGDDGYAIPASSGIVQALAGEGGEPISLVSVNYDDTVYKKVLGYFVGEQRKQIDIDFPLYVNGGVGLRFFGEENWLITPEADAYQTFDGLYVNEGISYNIDMSRADEETFIFLMLDGGIFMNVQNAVFENRVGTRNIPTNSVLMMRESSIGWYEYKNGTLGYFFEDSVFDATITIGGVTYDYFDLLKALGLMREAIEAGEGNRPDPEKGNQAGDILNPNPNDKGDGKDNNGSGDATTPGDGTQGGTSTPGEAGQPSTGDEVGEGNTDKDDHDKTPGENQGNEGDSTGDGDGAAESGSSGEGGGSGDNGGDDSGGGSGGDSGAPESGQNPELPPTVDTPGTGGDSTSGDGSGGSGDDGENTEDPNDPSGDGSSSSGGSSSGGSTLVTFYAKILVEGKAPKGSEFTFTLKDNTGKTVQTVNNIDGNISFDALKFEQEGTFTYTLSEVPGTDPLMVYDDTVFTANVVVTKVDRYYMSEVFYYKDGELVDGTIKFENFIFSDPVVELVGKKYLDGKAPEGSEFSFVIRDKNLEVVEIVNNADSVITFTPMTFTEEGYHTFYISEVIGENEKMMYDNTVYTVNILVARDEHGILRAHTSMLRGELAYNGTLVFSNSLTTAEGEQKPLPYTSPKVTISNFDRWCYATDLHLEVVDPSSTITRGVKFAVYTKLKGSGKSYTDELGHKVYSSEDYEGQSLMLRTTRTGTQDLSLSPLRPGQTVYIQFSYRYYYEDTELQDVPVIDPITGEEKKDENGNVITEKKEVTVRKRTYFYSDFHEMDIPTVEESEVKAVAVDWTTQFAAYADAFGLENLTVANTSAYDAELAKETHSFENFKLNTLPYVNRMEMNLTPEGGGDTLTVMVNYTTLTRAQKAPVTFKSNNPKLDSNTKYNVTVVLRDRYGNKIPAITNSIEYDRYSEVIYSQKQKPVVTITEVSNITDSLTLRLDISDPDGALKKEQPLRFIMTSSGINAALYGKWKDGTSFGNEQTTVLELPEPCDGAVYEFTLESLAFARLFTAEADGIYHPQPDGVTEHQLQPVGYVDLGHLSVYTASLSTGQVNFTTSFSNVLDTSATVNATMTSNSTVDILPLVDEFRIYLKDSEGKLVHSHKTVLDYDVLSSSDSYEHKDNAIVLEEGSFTEPRVLLYGDTSQVRENPWNSFCISEVFDDISGDMTYTTPMQLRIVMPEGYLSHFTKYTLTIDAVVIKGGEEYFIPVSLTNSGFTTKKTIPVIEYDDLFIASDIAQFVDMKITDPDGTILRGGTVTAQLYYGSTLLSVQTVQADQTKDGSAPLFDLRFDGLIIGGDYTIKFVAAEYNDEEGYGAYRTNYTLATYNIVGGSDLTGDLNLEKLTYRSDSASNLINMDETFVIEKSVMASSKLYRNSQYDTYVIPVKPNTKYEVSYDNYSGAVYWGFVNENDLDFDNVPTSANAVAVATGYGGNSTKGENSRRHTSSAASTHLLISHRREASQKPEIFNASIFVREYSAVSTEERYDVLINASAVDKKGYLGRGLEEGETPALTLTVECSESMELPEYKEYAVYKLPLVSEEDGSLTIDYDHIMQSLLPNKGWRVTLTGVFQGRDIELDQITFRTDGKYIPVSTYRQLYDTVRVNPYGNVLVTSDMVWDYNGGMSLYGTVDFQGHVVSVDENIKLTTYMFPYIYHQATVRNVVFDYPKVSYFAPSEWAIFAYAVYGTVDNFMVRTYGQLELKSAVINTIQQGGELKNFIYKLGGDVLLNNALANSYRGLVCNSMYGKVDSGYVYGVNGAGIMQVGEGETSVFGYQYYSEGVNNVYVLADNWQRVNDAGELYTQAFLLSSQMGGYRDMFNNVYTVGEFYAVSADMKKSYMLPLSLPRYAATDYPTQALNNVYYITGTSGVTPVASTNDKLAGTAATVANLRDPIWQKDILGGGNFDIDGCIGMGFYPRLNLSQSMLKYQEYITLPIMSAVNAPSIISDRFGDESDYGKPGLNEGTIVIRMRNDTSAIISDIKIENLTSTIISQEMTKDGFYEVILSTQVDPSDESYVSSYHIYEMTYISGSIRRTVEVDYNTVNIEFWKEVRSVADWHAINSNMRWNYKLTADIDFKDVPPGQVVINGRLDNYANTSGWLFYGKIDGQEHILKNITLENIGNPYVIAYAYTDSVIKNLLIDNMRIVSNGSPAQPIAGFIRYAVYAQIENVHIRNSHVTGSSSVGLMVGQAGSYTNIKRCSVVDSTVTDINANNTLIAGGFVGYATTGSKIDCCYTRNVAIDVKNSNAMNGVGGFVGNGNGVVYTNCYSHGSIVTSGSYVGGFIGNMYSSLNGQTYVGCISYVDILQTSGDFAGGFSGRDSAPYNSMVLGNVSGAGSHTNRIYANSTSVATSAYSWDGQLAGSLTSSEAGDATEIFSGVELGRVTTWQDAIALGDKWDYSHIENGNMPLISDEYDCANPEWKQKEIALPGQSGDPILQFINAYYDDNDKDGLKYSVTIRLEHPANTAAEIQAMFKDKSMSIEITGMELTDSAVADGKAEILLDSYDETISTGSDRYSLLRIRTSEATLAYDSYQLIIKYNDGRDRELSTMITYLELDGTPHINWLDISNLDQWNNAMEAGHGYNDENIRITGIIDFGGGPTQFKNLRFNRLSGISPETSGFKNMRFVGGPSGDGWIDKVGVDLSNLSFANSTFNFEGATVSRPRTSVIQIVQDVNNLVLEDITMLFTYNTGAYAGFISDVYGDIDGITMKNITMSNNKTTAGRYYAAAFASRAVGNIENVTAENITVNMPGNYYVGGLVGYHEIYRMESHDISFTGVNIKGYIYVGGVYGRTNSGYYKTSVKGVAETAMNKIECTYNNKNDPDYAAGYVGGISGMAYWYTNVNTRTGVTAENLKISSMQHDAGGISGYIYMEYWYDVLVKNCEIYAENGIVGGVAGNVYYGLVAHNIQIVDCKISSDGTRVGGVFGTTQTSSSYNRLLYGSVVRNTDISGSADVGGFAGLVLGPVQTYNFKQIYIAEDVTVHGDSNIGGVIGRTWRFNTLESVICGAKVTGKTAIGGIIGCLDTQSDGSLPITMKNVIYVGDVSASTDYAAGLVGKLNSSVTEFTDTMLQNCVISANVISGGSKGSFWANDTGATAGAGRGTVYLNEDSVLNGQTARAIFDATTALGQQSFVVPDNDDQASLLIAASEFNDPDFYLEKLGIPAANIDVSHLGDGNVYMPFIRGYFADEVRDALYYSNHNSADEADGILLPEAKPSAEKTVVYASGPNTINIEAPVPDGADGTTVKIGGVDMTTNADGVITVYYDFESDFTVGDITYKATDVGRRVMTYGDYWYYIKDGEVHYGNAVGTPQEMQEAGTVPGITGAKHLWQGRVIADEGIYSLLGGSTSTPVSVGNHLERSPIINSFWADGTVTVFHDYTIIGESKLPYRVFVLDKTPYTVSTAQKAVYDGIILTTSGSGSATKRYFATLGEDGKMTAYISNMLMGNVRNEGINHISNNLGYSGTVLIACYDNGDIIGVDITTGAEICSTVEQSFFKYAADSFKGLFTGSKHTNVLESEGTYVVSESNQKENEQKLESLKPNGDTALSPDGADGNDGNTGSMGTAPSEGNQNNGSGSQSGEGNTSSGTGEGSQTGNTDGEQVSTPSTGDGDGGSGGTSTPGDSSFDAGSANQGGSSSGTGSGTDGDGVGESGNIDVSGSSGSTGNIGNTGSSGSAEAPSEGSNEGSTPADGGEDVQPDNDNSSESGAQNSELEEIFGESILVYAPEAGGYVAVGTNTVSGTNPVALTTAIKQNTPKDDIGDKEDSKPQDNDISDKKNGNILDIFGGIGRDLYSAEKQGFVFIAVAAGIALITLIILYFTVFKKRKDNN